MRPARMRGNSGVRCHDGTTVRSRGVPAAAAAAPARSKYSPEPSVDWCGVSTIPTTRSTPSSARAATASSMVGDTYLVPSRTTNRPGSVASSRSATPWTWARVRPVRGDVPPMAS